jgi:septal ring factor EnvC (AmiA/AmiB activator)
MSEPCKPGFCFMDDQSRFERPPRPDRHSRKARIFVLTLLAVALIAPLGVYETIPVKQHKATAPPPPPPPPPDPTSQAIHDLQTSLQQAVNQLRALQQTVSSDRAEIKRLSDQVNALSGKLEALQQSIASAQQAPQAPVVQPTEPPRQKRATAR